MFRIALMALALFIIGCEGDLAPASLDTGMEEVQRGLAPQEDPTLEISDDFVCFPDSDSESDGFAAEEAAGCHCPIPAGHQAVTDMCKWCNAFNCKKTQCSYQPVGGGAVTTTYCKW